MRLIFAAIVPWMALSAAGEPPLPATLTLASNPISLSNPAVRLGDELFVPVNMAAKFGWQAQINGSTAKVQVNGRPVTTFVRKISNEKYLPVRTILSSVGGLSEWTDKKSLRAFSKIVSIEVTNNSLVVNGTLPMNRKIIILNNPSRIAMDLYPAKIDSASPSVTGPVRFSQFDNQTVRVVAQFSNSPKLENEPSKPLQPKVAWSGAAPISANVVAESAPKNFNILGATIEKDSDDEGCIWLATNARVSSDARCYRDKDGTFVINFPGGTLPEKTSFDLTGKLIQKGTFETHTNGIRLRLLLKRPMKVRIQPENDGMMILLEKPAGIGPLKDRIIIIDPGHGGNDPGAHFESSTEGNLSEKEITLAVSQYVSEMLTELGATSILTRNEDLFIGLKERPAIADNTGGHFFVSIHVNSNQIANSRSGPTTYFHKESPDSRLLAECIQAELVKMTGLSDNGVRSDTTIYDNGFAVLRHANVPAVLVELCYINHNSDRQLLRTEEFRRKLAAAIVQGIKVYLGDSKKEKTQ